MRISLRARASGAAYPVSGCLLPRVSRVTSFILIIQFGPHKKAALWYEFRTCFYLPDFRSYNALNERVEAGKIG